MLKVSFYQLDGGLKDAAIAEMERLIPHLDKITDPDEDFNFYIDENNEIEVFVKY